MKNSEDFLRIIDFVQEAVIVAHNEDVGMLSAALVFEGFTVRINRYSYNDVERQYSPIIRCLLNHASVWRSIVESGRPALVVEADFVPCIGFSSHPVPFPDHLAYNSWGWLYMTGPTVYEWVHGKARGHSASPVATIIPPSVAQSLVEYSEEVLSKSPQKYQPWDAGARYFVQQRGCPSFLSFRNLGEHGGIPNPEHKDAVLRSKHRADALAARLHFRPLYARGSRLFFLLERLEGRLWGLGRLVCGRYLPLKTLHETQPTRAKLALLWFSLIRHLSIW